MKAFWGWVGAHRKLRLFVLGLMLTSVMSGCPITYTPFLSGRVVDSGGNPIGGATVSYGLTQFKSHCFIQRTSTASDGTFSLPIKFAFTILPTGRIYIGAYHPLYEGTFQDDKVASYEIIRTPCLFRKIELHLQRVTEIKHGPLMSYEITHRLNSPPDNAEQTRELLALATQYKVPYKSEDVAGLIDVLLNSRESSSREQAVEFLEQHNTGDVIKTLKDVMLADSDEGVRHTCRLAIWRMTGSMPYEFTVEDAQRFEKRLSSPEIEHLLHGLRNYDPAKKKLLAEIEALEKYKSLNAKGE